MLQKNPWILREAEIQDALVITELVNSAYRGEEAKKGWTTEAHILDGQRIDKNGIKKIISSENCRMLLVELTSELKARSETLDAGNVIACVELQKQNDQCYLGMLTVRPTIQNLGLGKWLLDNCESYAKHWGCEKIVMNVITNRDELIAWYKRRGYHETGVFKDFPTDPAFGIPKVELKFEVYEKKLTDKNL